MPTKTTFFLKNDILQDIKLLSEFDGVSQTQEIDTALREYTKRRSEELQFIRKQKQERANFRAREKMDTEASRLIKRECEEECQKSH